MLQFDIQRDCPAATLFVKYQSDMRILILEICDLILFTSMNRGSKVKSMTFTGNHDLAVGGKYYQNLAIVKRRVKITIC